VFSDIRMQTMRKENCLAFELAQLETHAFALYRMPSNHADSGVLQIHYILIALRFLRVIQQQNRAEQSSQSRAVQLSAARHGADSPLVIVLQLCFFN